MPQTTPQRGRLYQPRATPWVRKYNELQALKGRLKAFYLTRPYRAFDSIASKPRALPWAKISRPFGAKSRCHSAYVALPWAGITCPIGAFLKSFYFCVA